MDRFHRQLHRQIGFLRNSCDGFDTGNWDEAIRIATCIRILVHDTRNSTSLLKHLNSTHIKLFSVHKVETDCPKGVIQIDCFSMGVIKADMRSIGYGPMLENPSSAFPTFLPLSTWWNQVVWKLSPKLHMTRKDIILSAANQDGGAHVDANIDPGYQKLAEGSFGTMSINQGELNNSVSIEKMHLVTIRTIANEILNSPDLTDLLNLR